MFVAVVNSTFKMSVCCIKTSAHNILKYFSSISPKNKLLVLMSKPVFMKTKKKRKRKTLLICWQLKLPREW